MDSIINLITQLLNTYTLLISTTPFSYMLYKSPTLYGANNPSFSVCFEQRTWQPVTSRRRYMYPNSCTHEEMNNQLSYILSMVLQFPRSFLICRVFYTFAKHCCSSLNLSRFQYVLGNTRQERMSCCTSHVPKSTALSTFLRAIWA